ncbi:MAG TPA: serine hydrolase domain-containing protein [Cyclobacteriaceae bacterium]
MSRLLYLFVFLAFVVACSAPKKDDSEKESGIVTTAAKVRIDSTLKAMVDAGKIAGVSALIVEKDKEVYFNAFGQADREASKAFDRNTVVRIYSMTKPVTGVALMKLYEEGKFQLDDPLARYLPEFRDVKVYEGANPKGKLILVDPDRPITVRDITRHTAGFASGGDTTKLGEIMRKADVLNRNITLGEFTKRLAKVPLAFHPGAQWSYGVCVDVQARLVEVLSGKTFDVYVNQNILNPLKMTNTGYVPKDMSKLAALYRAQDGALNRVPDSLILANVNQQVWPLKPGGFGLTSTVDDYQRFARMLVNEGTFDGATILKPETVKLMATNQLADSVTKRMWLPSKGQVGFGIDFAVRMRPPADETEKNGVVGEFFWDGAASTLFWIDPVNDLTAVMFVQIFPFSNELHKVFRDAVYGPPMPAAPVATGQ